MSAVGEIKLRPCPFCGCDQLSLKRGQWVRCTQCQAEGPLVPGEGEAAERGAIEKWNTRADDQRKPGDAT